MKIKLTIFLLLFTLTGIACTCEPPRRFNDELENEWNRSTDIVRVEIISIDFSNGIATGIVLENFKGTYFKDDDVKIGFSLSCFPYIKSTGIWMIYAHNDNEVLRVNKCGLSRDLSKPKENNHFNLPLPPEQPDKIKTSDTSEEKKEEKRKHDDMQSFLDNEAPKLELEYLRNKKKPVPNNR